MKKITAVLVTLAVAVLMLVLIFDAAKPKPLTSSFFSMNTYVSAEVEGKNAQKNLEEIKSKIDYLDVGVLSRTAKNSLTYQLNENGEAEFSSDEAAYISLLLQLCKDSDGAFDFTLGKVSDLWNFSGTPRIPEKAALDEALSHTGYGKIAVNGNKVTKSDPLAEIDFGASGKGIALDYVASYLDTQDCERAVVSVGGSVLLYGQGDFTVGIRNPYGNQGSYMAKLTLEAGCVSTSGTYEQSFEENGKNYHHILNPETGYPVENDLVSVTVVSENGLLSDALSTACFVLGREKGAELAESYGAEIIFVTKDNIIHSSPGIADAIEITDTEFSFSEG